MPNNTPNQLLMFVNHIPYNHVSHQISFKTLLNFKIKCHPLKMLLFVSFGVLEHIIVVC